ncbi:MAG TPA: Co2+/Mg2+ efflux protein ApaG [Burkholderiaceae bacterium]|nr:Co2+/Mg2+ efflux protein ApaG [Burkholderiaceae bacterium]
MAKYEFTVRALPRYLAEQSAPESQQHTWSYTIRLTNTGNVGSQLISRHWIITDANGRVQEVRGLGVVGQQPLLKPGETYEYTSGVTLTTPTGSMHGLYFCTAEDGTQFEVPIPEFNLAAPSALH